MINSLSKDKEKFNPLEENRKIVNWIREYFKNQPSAKGAIIGISGGKDSLVAAKLLVEALGRERVLGVLMPNGVQKDIEDSFKVVEVLGIQYEIVNIEKAYSGLLEAIEENMQLSMDAKINIPPRLRMTVLYALGAKQHYRVCGTGNKSEAFVGYTTKWGDNACDFNPIGDFTTEEVIALGDSLGLPYNLVHKAPNDGLSGITDEEKLGVTYNQINGYIERGKSGDKDSDEKIRKKHEYSEHKRVLPPKYLRERCS